MTFARLTAVYSLQPSELMDVMPLAMLEAYIERIPKIIAERRVQAASAASLPYMEDPQKILNDWIDEAFEGDEMKKEAATPGMLKLMGIGVEHAPKLR